MKKLKEKKKSNKPQLVSYGIWSTYTRKGYWSVSSTLHEAVALGEPGDIVYKLTAERLGEFEIEVKPKKTKQ